MHLPGSTLAHCSATTSILQVFGQAGIHSDEFSLAAHDPEGIGWRAIGCGKLLFNFFGGCLGGLRQALVLTRNLEVFERPLNLPEVLVWTLPATGAVDGPFVLNQSTLRHEGEDLPNQIVCDWNCGGAAHRISAVIILRPQPMDYEAIVTRGIAFVLASILLLAGAELRSPREGQHVEIEPADRWTSIDGGLGHRPRRIGGGNTILRLRLRRATKRLCMAGWLQRRYLIAAAGDERQRRQHQPCTSA